ncbi:MAG TPA: DUF6168 family protein [Flavobacteriaceae bacterium]|nr:DUF6168 family protein [Flavobacteriaceae bacterium]
MTKLTTKFLSYLSLILILSYFIHFFSLKNLQLPTNSTLLLPAYLANYILAIVIFFSLLFLQKKYEHLLGFIFMGGSFLKFAIFFILFYPTYRLDTEITRLEATSFLIPYLLSLAIETYFLIRLLNKKTK